MATTTAPSGWLLCNGSAISRSTYAALFAVVGTLYGVGDGVTTFNVPELRGEFLRGADQGRGIDAGRAVGTAQAGQMPSHDHGPGGQNTLGGVINGEGIPGSIATSVREIVGLVAEGGTENASENRPRNVSVLYCIKA